MRVRRWIAAGVAVAIGAAPIGAQAADQDYCAGGEHTSLLLVDRTTKFDAIDQDILVRTVDSFFQRQAVGERVIVAEFTGSYTDLRLVFNECHPGCPDDGFFARLTSTCRAVVARSDALAFEARFIATLRDLLVQPVDSSASDLFRSVAEATRLVSANGYPPLHQMLFYSDLLEASPLFPAPTIRHLQPADVLHRLDADHVEPMVKGADVRVVGFGRNDAPGRAALPQDVRRRVADSWTRWFQNGGAAEIQIGLR